MLGIRTITYQLPTGFDDAEMLCRIRRCSNLWEKSFEKIHTQRLCLPALREPVPLHRLDALLDLCEITPIRWVNVPVLWTTESRAVQVSKFVLELLDHSGRTFSNLIAVDEGEVHAEAIQCYSGLIHKVGRLDYSGCNNFRLGLSFNIGYDGPFFPFTRARGKELSFTIGLEMMSEFNQLLAEASFKTLSQLQAMLLEKLTPSIRALESLAQSVSEQSGIRFGGFDFSLAPEMSDTGSVIPLLNALGVYNFGQSGTMFATAFWTDLLKYFAAKHPSVGFSGVMYSLLEDRDLCSINNERGITMNQLTILSTMCGCGLDMVPVSGDVSEEEVYALCLDIAAISCRLKKPLGIRLLPIPGTRRGQRTFTHINSDADFISNTRIVPLDVNVMADVGGNFEFVRYGK